ncbi:hypothetical protein MASR2M16_35520 [Thauera terpenica]
MLRDQGLYARYIAVVLAHRDQLGSAFIAQRAQAGHVQARQACRAGLIGLIVRSACGWGTDQPTFHRADCPHHQAVAGSGLGAHAGGELAGGPVCAQEQHGAGHGRAIQPAVRQLQRAGRTAAAGLGHEGGG